MTEEQPTPQRRPMTGSCHCGFVRYVAFLVLPHVAPPLPYKKTDQCVYRCNCTTCHKTGHFHVHPCSPTHDFLLLSPVGDDPLAELGDYTCFDGNLHWYFCKRCGVRPFLFAGDGEFVTVDLDEIGVPKKDGDGEGQRKVKAWRPRLGGGHPEMGHYLSVNGHTIDAGQGFDMRELTEKNVVSYCDCYSAPENEVPQRYGKPQLHGCY